MAKSKLKPLRDEPLPPENLRVVHITGFDAYQHRKRSVEVGQCCHALGSPQLPHPSRRPNCSRESAATDPFVHEGAFLLPLISVPIWRMSSLRVPTTSSWRAMVRSSVVICCPWARSSGSWHTRSKREVVL